MWDTDLINCKDDAILLAKPVKTFSGGKKVFEVGK